MLLLLLVLWIFKRDTTDPYQNMSWGRFSGSCPSSEIPEMDFGKRFQRCDYSVPEDEIPTFSEVQIPHRHEYDGQNSLPLMASAMIDLDNDGIEEVFMSGGKDQQDAIYRFDQGAFIDITSEVGLPSKPEGTTYGATSFDLDGNGYNDLLLTGDYGLYWYKQTAAGFERLSLDAPLNSKSSAATTTLGDIDNDGDIDIFLSAYIYRDQMEGQTIFKDKSYGASSLLLRNKGDGTFEDVTEAFGLSYIHNTFQGVLVDVDKDGYLDLVVAYDTGEVRTYRNEGGNGFSLMPNPLTGKYAYPMGIGVGDYNNDDQIDFFFSNTGSSVPAFMARGDLEDEDIYVSQWLMYRNDGDFGFTDVAAEVKVADFEFSWGAVMEDFNLDGRQDLVVAENYVSFPPHKLFKLPCRFLVQRPDGTFAAVEDQAGVINKNYAITPLVADFNADGYPDLLYANLSGQSRAFINKGGDHNYIAFRFAEKAANAGAHVSVKLDDDSVMSDVYVIGEGLASDQTSTITFGLDVAQSVKEVKISLPGGTQRVLDNPDINKVHFLD